MTLTAHSTESVERAISDLTEVLDRIKRFLNEWKESPFRDDPIWINQEAYREKGLYFINLWIDDAEKRLAAARHFGRVVPPRRQQEPLSGQSEKPVRKRTKKK